MQPDAPLDWDSQAAHETKKLVKLFAAAPIQSAQILRTTIVGANGRYGDIRTEELTMVKVLAAALDIQMFSVLAW